MDKSEKCEKKTLDRADVATLTYVYGKDVTSYLSESDITKKKTKTGSFLISKNEHFQECRRRFKAHLVEISRGKKKTKIGKTEKEPLGDCYKLPENFQCIVNDDMPFEHWKNPVGTEKGGPLNCETQSVSTVTIDDISFEESFKNHIEWLTIPKVGQCTVRTEWDYDEICLPMTSSTLDLGHATKYNSCSEGLKAILREFHQKHENFYYVATLKRILASKKDGGKKSPRFVSLHDFQKYFSQIFAKVIPLTLFGNNRNEKKARRVLKDYYLAPFGETISLKSFLQRIKISCVTWLQPIQDEATRWTVFGKVIKWIFEYYFSLVLKSVFLVRKASDSNQKQFLLYEKWIADERKYIRGMKKNKAIVRCVPDSNIPKSMPPGQLLLIPKQTGIRPIYMSPIKKNSVESKELELFKTLLQQLYYERHEYTKITDLRSILKSCSNQNEEGNHHRWQLVACDIQDAFGSIVQAKLFDIVNAMMNDIPNDTLVTRWYAVLTRPQLGTEPKLYYTRGFTCFSEAPIFRSCSLATPIDGERFPPENMKKGAARTCIKNLIFNQRFQLGERVYLLKQGVLQGSPLSPILADIYYGTMRDQVFHSFIRSDTLFRFVDDFLFISEDNCSATKFLQLVNSRIAEYNCRFKKSKIQSNVRSSLCKESKSIHYLGYRIDGITLDVHPEFERISYRYLLKVPPTLWNPVEWFSQRLNKITSLKLNGIVLDASINSTDAIVTTARLAAYRMASRCAILIPAIFKEMSRAIKIRIMKEIRSIVAMLARIFKRHLDERKRDATMGRIRVSIWEAFFRVFAKYVNLRRLFCNDIKIMLQLSKRC